VTNFSSSFDGGRLTTNQLTAVRLQPDELAAYAFHDLAAAATLSIPRLAQRIMAATAARSTGCPAYLGYGLVVTGR
jgi:8-oxo-dGTP diphosphatase